MPSPAIGAFHRDELATSMSIAYMQSQRDFIATRFAPVVPVEKASGEYWVYDRAAWLRDQMAARPMGGEPDEAVWSQSVDTYSATEKALRFYADDRVIANASPPADVRRDAVEFLTRAYLIHRERLWATDFFGLGIWTTDLTGVPAAPGAGQFVQWSVGGSTPIQDIQAQIRAIGQLTGYRPNKLILGVQVYHSLLLHADIRAQVMYTTAGPVSDELLARILGVEEVLVPWGVYNSNPAGETMAWAIASDDALLAYVAPRPGLLTPSAAYTFAWNGLSGMNGYEMAIFQGRKDEAYSDYWDVRAAWDHKVTSADMAVFFNTAVA